VDRCMAFPAPVPAAAAVWGRPESLWGLKSRILMPPPVRVFLLLSLHARGDRGLMERPLPYPPEGEKQGQRATARPGSARR